MIASFDFDVVTGPSLQRREDVPAGSEQAATAPHQPAPSSDRDDALYSDGTERR